MQKDIFHANYSQKRAGIVLLITDKIDFRSKELSRYRGHYILVNFQYSNKIGQLSTLTPLIRGHQNI